jgi:hypothetical protein
VVVPALCAKALSIGLQPDFVQDVIRRFQLSPPEARVRHWPWPLKFVTFGRVLIARGDVPIDLSKRARKPLEPLKAIVVCGGRDVEVLSVAGILAQIGLGPNGRPWDCRACGFDTCRRFAEAVREQAGGQARERAEQDGHGDEQRGLARGEMEVGPEAGGERADQSPGREAQGEGQRAQRDVSAGAGDGSRTGGRGHP